MELLDYLPSGWKLQPTNHGLLLMAPDSQQGKDFVTGAKQYLTETAQNIRGVIEVCAQTGGQVAEIKPTQTLSSPIIQVKTELDWTAIQGGATPVYITQLADQHNLYLNHAAVLAQSGKPPAEFLSATAHALNFEEELSSRCARIEQDGELTDYPYEAMRWFRDEQGRWIRRRMQFFSNFWKVNYLGQECWLGEVLQATPLEQFVDSK